MPTFVCPVPTSQREAAGWSRELVAMLTRGREGGRNSSELAFSDWFFESCRMHFTYIANNFFFFFAKDLGRRLGLGSWGAARPTAALEGALGWIWSISYAWEAAKPCGSRNISTAFNGTVYSLEFRDFAGWVSQQGLTAQRLHLTHGEPCSCVSGCLLPTCF